MRTALRFLLVFVIILGMMSQTPDNMLARYDLEGDMLIKVGISAGLTLLIALQNIGFVLVMLMLIVGANLPPEVAEQYHINRDYILGTLIAVIAMPIIQRIIR